MVPAIIVSPDLKLADELERAVQEAGQVAVVRKLADFPTEHDLGRLIRALAPQIFFVNVEWLPQAVAMAAQIEALAPGIQVMAFARSCEQATLLELMRAGIREFVAVPMSIHELPSALLRLNSALAQKPPSIDSTDLLFSFLPSKPGVGCSTVALNASVAVAALPDMKTLLADFDLNCGMIGFLLQLDNSRSIVDAAEYSASLDETMWPKLVQSRGNLDLLPAGLVRPGFRIETAQIRYLLDFARRNYKVICVDLSGLMERFSVDLMQESKRIFLVCTPELPSIHLARQRLDFLRSLELEGRVSVLLNRAQRRSLIPPEEIEKLIGLPVLMELPNDYKGVHKAFSGAKPVDSSSELGKRFKELASKMVERDAGQKQQKRFVDYFAITPARYSFNDPPKR